MDVTKWRYQMNYYFLHKTNRSEVTALNTFVQYNYLFGILLYKYMMC